jgi:DNA processing protein
MVYQYPDNNEKGRYEIFSCNVEYEYYPSALKSLQAMPRMLYYKGAIEIINRNKNVAVIGTRQSSESGMRLSYEAGRTVGELGLNLVNGLALGCDTEAIKGALSVGGKCIAIMPCGLDQIQPKSNRKLAEEILDQGGCLLSEYPAGTGIEKYRYVERDRIQSGISQGVLVIEAEEKSGTMHTANAAIRQNKRLACYYHELLKHSSGNKYLESSGKAEVLKTKTDMEDFLERVLQGEQFEQLSFHFEP